jgi:hypothetical protein
MQGFEALEEPAREGRRAPPSGAAPCRHAACLFLELSLLTECRRWTQRALASLEIGSRKEMELQAALGVSVMFTKGNARRLAQTFEDSPWQVWLLRGLHIYLTRIGDFHGALRIGEQDSSVANASHAARLDWRLSSRERLADRAEREPHVSFHRGQPAGSDNADERVELGHAIQHASPQTSDPDSVLGT